MANFVSCLVNTISYYDQQQQQQQQHPEKQQNKNDAKKKKKKKNDNNNNHLNDAKNVNSKQNHASLLDLLFM